MVDGHLKWFKPYLPYGRKKFLVPYSSSEKRQGILIDDIPLFPGSHINVTQFYVYIYVCGKKCTWSFKLLFISTGRSCTEHLQRLRPLHQLSHINFSFLCHF